MNRLKWRVAAAASLLAIAIQNAPAVERIGLLSRNDHLRFCIQQVLGRPLLKEVGKLDSSAKCPAPRAAVIDNLQKAGWTIFETDEWVYLMPTAILHPTTQRSDSERVQWRQLRIVPRLKNWDGIPGSRALTDVEQRQISREIYWNARLPDLSAPRQLSSPWGDRSPDEKTLLLPFDVMFDVHRLRPTNVESVVTILSGGGPGGSRLVYGEISDRRYEVKWDSRMFYQRRMQMGYRDVTGDGVKEILLQSVMGNGADEFYAFTIFDSRGNELTRQPYCEQEGLPYMYGENGTVCSMVAREFELQANREGSTDIVATGVIEDLISLNPNRARRYRLSGGHYSLLSRIRKK
jgi:hypothetical protein